MLHDNDGKDKIPFLQELGRGSFGKTYLSKEKNEFFVVKHMTYIQPFNHNRWLRIIHSEKNAFNLSHPNIVKTQQMIWKNEHNIYICMEFGGNLTLYQIIETKTVEPTFKIHCMKSIVCGLIYLHVKNIVHLDLKPSNILYHDLRNIWKISDFGASVNITQNIRNKKTEEVFLASPIRMFISCTIPFSSPEVFKGQPVSTKMDIYSIGCILWCIFEWSNILYPTITPEEIIFSVCSTNNRPLFKHASLKEQKLCQKSWHKDPSERPTAEILNNDLNYLFTT